MAAQHENVGLYDCKEACRYRLIQGFDAPRRRFWFIRSLVEQLKIVLMDLWSSFDVWYLPTCVFVLFIVLIAWRTLWRSSRSGCSSTRSSSIWKKPFRVGACSSRHFPCVFLPFSSLSLRYLYFYFRNRSYLYSLKPYSTLPAAVGRKPQYSDVCVHFGT